MGGREGEGERREKERGRGRGKERERGGVIPPTFKYPPTPLQDTRCSTDTHQLRAQKFRCCGTAPMEHFAVYVTTDDQLRIV